MDVNCRWSLNRWGYMTHCFTRFPRTITASVTVCPKSNKPFIVICVYCVGHVWWPGCNYRWVVRPHGCIAWRIWHLAVLLLLIMCTDQTYCCLSHKYHSKPFYNHFSLCTEMGQKLYWNGPPTLLYWSTVVQAESACSSCTETGLYRSRPPPVPKRSCTDLVLPPPKCPRQINLASLPYPGFTGLTSVNLNIYCKTHIYYLIMYTLYSKRFTSFATLNHHFRN